MQLGAEAVFVGSGIFMKDSSEFCSPEDAYIRATAIVKLQHITRIPRYCLK